MRAESIVTSKKPPASVTAIIPCYNCESVLERAVVSVVEQTQRPATIIIVDDASTDGTAQIIHEIQKKYGQDWIQSITLKENGGPAVARNTAWNLAREPYAAFLDADDAWHREKIKIQWSYMTAHPEITLSAHSCKKLRSHDRINNNAIVQEVHLLNRSSLLVSNQIATRSVMIKRDLPYRFSNTKRYAEDYLLWLQMACDRKNMVYLDANLAFYYKSAYGEGGLSANLWKMEKGELAVYWQLVRERRITRWIAILTSAYSLVKYVRRIMIVAARQSSGIFHKLKRNRIVK